MVFYLLSRFWPSNRRSFNQFLCQLKEKHSSFKGSSFVIHLSLSEGHFTLKTFVSRFEKCTWVFVDAGYENLDRICILLYFGSFCKNIDIPTPQLIVLLITLENLSLQPFLPESMHQKQCTTALILKCPYYDSNIFGVLCLSSLFVIQINTSFFTAIRANLMEFNVRYFDAHIRGTVTNMNYFQGRYSYDEELPYFHLWGCLNLSLESLIKMKYKVLF